jgi:hypothetical protein
VRSKVWQTPVQQSLADPSEMLLLRAQREPRPPLMRACAWVWWTPSGWLLVATGGFLGVSIKPKPLKALKALNKPLNNPNPNPNP